MHVLPNTKSGVRVVNKHYILMAVLSIVFKVDQLPRTTIYPMKGELNGLIPF